MEPKISDATQVMQSTITPASAPKSNINEKRFGPEPKTVGQARRGVPVCRGPSTIYLVYIHKCDPVTLSHR